MLAKLLKYELKATGRIFLPIYAGLLVVSVVASFVLQSPFEILNSIFIFLIASLYIALVVVTIVLLVQRFYQNLLKDEGYLMFTLPVSPATLISSKLIATLVWIISSSIVGFFAALIAARSFIDLSEISRNIQDFFSNYPFPPSIIVMGIVAILVSFVYSILQVYFSLSIGQLPTFGKHKILFAIIAYIGISVVVQILSGIVSVFAAPYIESQVRALDFYAQTPYSYTFVSTLLGFFNKIFGWATAIQAILAGLMFVGTYWILKNKLNLE